MKKRSRTSFNLFIITVLGSLFATSCFEPEEGCLDSNAVNFEVLADENCCCTYPLISVGLFQMVGEADHHEDSIYTNNLGQEYRIIAQSFYISQMQMAYDDGSVSQVLDTLELEIPLGSSNDVVLEDNYGLIKHTSPAYTAGHIKENGSITEVNFLVGLDEEARQLIPDQLPNSHPLGSNNQSDQYVENQGYIEMKWEIIVLNIPGVDTISLNTFNFSSPVSLSANPSIPVSPGSNTTIALEIDYADWLEGIDFAEDITLIESGIRSNSINSFDLRN